VSLDSQSIRELMNVIDMKFVEQFKVEIPRWQREYVFKSEVKPIYYKKGMQLPASYKKRLANKQYIWKLYNGAQTLWHVKMKKYILKNSKTANEPKTWNVNGQGFCSLHWRIKNTLTDYYKRYFSYSNSNTLILKIKLYL